MARPTFRVGGGRALVRVDDGLLALTAYLLGFRVRPTTIGGHQVTRNGKVAHRARVQGTPVWWVEKAVPQSCAGTAAPGGFGRAG